MGELIESNFANKKKGYMTDTQNLHPQPRDIMHYESDIWAIADLLLAASVKQSDFPAYMMPFFALMMLEGRMLNAMKRV